MRSLTTRGISILVMCAALSGSRAANCAETEIVSGLSTSEPKTSPLLKLEWTWLGAAATLTSGAVAMFLSLDAEHQEDKFSDKLNESKETPVSASSLLSLKDKAEDRARAANIMWGISGGLLIGTGVLLWLELRPAKHERRNALTATPGVGPEGVGLWVSGRF